MSTPPRRHALAALALALLVAHAGPAAAQPQPTFVFVSDKEREELAKAAADKVEWKASAQGGLIITAGNSRITALSAGLIASRKAGKNRLQLEGGLAYARSSVFVAADLNGNMLIEENEIQRPTSTTNRGWTSKARYDRFLTANNSLYGAAVAAADEPAGKEFVGGGQLGYSRQVYKDGTHLLVAEAGYDFSYENPVVGPGDPIHSARFFTGYVGKLSEDTGLDASIETLLNVNRYRTVNNTVEIAPFDDTRLTTKLALTTKMFGDVSFRFSFESKLDKAPSPRPPFGKLPYAPGNVPLADELDTKIEASLIVNLL
jgi:hypothetical protein